MRTSQLISLAATTTLTAAQAQAPTSADAPFDAAVVKLLANSEKVCNYPAENGAPPAALLNEHIVRSLLVPALAPASQPKARDLIIEYGPTSAICFSGEIDEAVRLASYGAPAGPGTLTREDAAALQAATPSFAYVTGSEDVYVRGAEVVKTAPNAHGVTQIFNLGVNQFSLNPSLRKVTPEVCAARVGLGAFSNFDQISRRAPEAKAYVFTYNVETCTGGAGFTPEVLASQPAKVPAQAGHVHRLKFPNSVKGLGT